jgi:hypothetical protein
MKNAQRIGLAGGRRGDAAPDQSKGARAGGSVVSPDDTVQKQSRRRTERGPQTVRPVASPDGRHVAEVIGGAVYVDGRRVRTSEGNAFVLAAADLAARRTCRRLDRTQQRSGARGRASTAWTTVSRRCRSRCRPVASDDRVFWAGQQRIHIGPALLAPRAVATWNE